MRLINSQTAKRDVALIVSLYFVKCREREREKKSTFCLECIVNFSLFIRHQQLAPSLDAKVRQSGPAGVTLGTDPVQTFFCWDFFGGVWLSDPPTVFGIFSPCHKLSVYVHCLNARRIALALWLQFSIVKPDTQSIFPASK